jgi:hypothetical protein
LRAVVTFDHVRHKQVGQLVFLVERALHPFLFNLEDGAVRNCGSGCQPDRLIRGQASFAQKIARPAIPVQTTRHPTVLKTTTASKGKQPHGFYERLELFARNVSAPITLQYLLLA